MSLLVISVWLGNILFDTIGQLAFKAGALESNEGENLHYWLNVARSPWIWLGVSCYIGEFLVWLAFLSLVPLSEGVLLGSINIVVIMIAGRFFFKEELTRLRVIGISLVAAGVAIVGAF